ncbi:hypothetical protein GCM10010219_14200 [Streptomyces netropsis]|nr:hypothetical protein GCM10010219_14200 [Streptomyces netropsis]
MSNAIPASQLLRPGPGDEALLFMLDRYSGRGSDRAVRTDSAADSLQAAAGASRGDATAFAERSINSADADPQTRLAPAPVNTGVDVGCLGSCPSQTMNMPRWRAPVVQARLLSPHQRRYREMAPAYAAVVDSALSLPNR